MKYDKIFSNVPENISWLKQNTILITMVGSIAQGLALPTSDEDYRGICIPPREYFYGYINNFEQFETHIPDDIVVFNIKKFFRLAANCNANILEIIFAPEEFHYTEHKALYRKIIDNRKLFLSKKVRETFVGYARGEAHKAKNHKRFIDSGEPKKPERSDFGLPKELTIPKDQYLTVNAIIIKKINTWNCSFEPFSDPQKIYLKNKLSEILTEMELSKDNQYMAAARMLGYNENFILLLQKEKQYQSALEQYQHYLDWKKNRNKKRYEMEEKCGYDAKNMATLIRVLKQGKEILENYDFKVNRSEDKEELLAIKQGKVKYEDVLSYADDLQKQVDAAYFKSNLPNDVDYAMLDLLCQEIIQEFFENK